MAGIKENTFRVNKALGLLLALVTLVGCNSGVQTETKQEKQTIAYNQFELSVDSDNKKQYLDTLSNPLTGHFVVMRDTLISQEFQVENGQLNGVHIFYNGQGKITSEQNYLNGELNGESITYYPSNGNVRSKESYAAGQRTGEVLEYNVAGQLVSKKTTSEGIDYVHYYRDEKIIGSSFIQTIEAIEYDLLVTYDPFENVNRVLGQKTNTDRGEWVYTFNQSFKLVDSVDMANDPQNAQLIYQILQDLAQQ